jgi:hypothetical protein
LFETELLWGLKTRNNHKSGDPATVSCREMTMKSSHGEKEGRCGPAEELKQQGSQAGESMVVKSLTLCDEE